MDNKNKPTFEVSIETRQVVERLVKCDIGEIVEYSELRTLIGRDARDRLETARKHLRKEHRMVFGTVNGVGLKRLADCELAKIGEASTIKIGREAKRAMQKMGCVDFKNLTSDQLSEWNSRASHLGLVAEVTRPKVAKAIEAKVKETQRELPVMKAIEAAFASN